MSFVIETILCLIVCVATIIYLRQGFVGNTYAFDNVNGPTSKPNISCTNGIVDTNTGMCKCTEPYFKNNSFNGDCTDLAYGFKGVKTTQNTDGNTEFDVTCSFPYLVFNSSKNACEMGTISNISDKICFNGYMSDDGTCVCNDGFGLLSDNKNVCVKNPNSWNLIDPAIMLDDVTKSTKCTLINRRIIFEYDDKQYCAYIPEIQNSVYISLDGTLHLFNNDKCIVSDNHTECSRVPARSPITAKTYTLNVRPLDSKDIIFQMVFNKSNYMSSNQTYDFDITGLLDETNFENSSLIPMPVKGPPNDDLQLQISKIKGLYYNLDDRTVKYM
jgi:hypothetical protein